MQWDWVYIDNKILPSKSFLVYIDKSIRGEVLASH